MINGQVIRFLPTMDKMKFLLFFLFTFLANVSFAGPDTIQQKIDYYLSQAEFDSAKIYIESQLDDGNQNRSALNYQLVKVLFIQSDYKEALEKAFYALDKLDNDKAQVVKYNFMIAAIYSAIKDYAKSIAYFDSVVKDSKDATLLVQAHLLSSQLYLELKDSTNAQQSLTEAYDISNGSDLDPKVKNHVSIQYHFYSGNYEACKAQNLKIIQDSTSFLNSKSYAFSMLGDCLVKQDSLMEATKYFDSFLALTIKTKDPEQVKVAAKKLIEVYEQLGIQEKANTYHKIYNEAMNDSLSFSIEKYRALHQVEGNREMTIEKRSRLKKYFGFGALLLLLLSGLAYYFFKIKNQNKSISSNIEKASGKKIIISDVEVEKIKRAVDQLIAQQLFLTPKITRKSFCIENEIKSERYLSQYVNTEYEKSFTVFLNDLRIEYAYNRIRNDAKFRNYRIEEIAKESGFGSKKSFERVFLAKYKETPYKLILSIAD